MSKKRALVIGSQLPPLQGVHADVNAMTAVLEGMNFAVDKRSDGDATRAGILEGYQRLIGNSDDEDVAVVYYSGHGGYALNGNPRPGERERLQCIFPSDWTDTGPFKAILDVELSKYMSDLTAKTKNVTVILDCCHAAELSRGPDPVPALGDLVPRVYGAVWADNVAEFLAQNPIDLSRVNVESNPHAVRLVAAEVERSAYEGQFFIDGSLQRRGIFTYSLLETLKAPGATLLSWQTIGNRVRELVLARAPQQRPIVEGPGNRLAFTTKELRRPDAVAYFTANGLSYLRANRILGANVGAVYDIMPFGSVDVDPTKIVAIATVVSLEGADAQVDIVPTEPGVAPQPGSPAFPKKLPYPPVPITIDGPNADQIREIIGNIRFAVEVPKPEDARFRIVANGTIEMWEQDERAATTLNNDASGRQLVSDRLARWAKAESLRSLQTTGLPPDAIGLAWGRAVDGKEIPNVPGDRLHVGEHIYVSFTNQTDRPLYAAVFDIGVGGKVTLLTAASPNGRLVAPGKTSYLGKHDNAAVTTGLGPVSWPADVPKESERRESLIVIASTMPTEFGLLENQPLPTRGALNRLEDLLSTVRDVVTRDFSAEPPPNQGFWVGRIDFDLVPTPRASFAVDQSLDARGFTQALTVLPKAVAAPVTLRERIAVRLNEMTIHDNRAFFGRSKIRVDTLVVTGAADNHVYRAATAYFPRIASGDAAPLQNLICYEGPVARFLDFGIWVSRDENDSLPLQELLDANAQSAGLRDAVMTLAGLSVAAPQAAAIAGAGLAVGTLVSFASKLLDATISKSIGVYRRSFLGHERFGLGRHPVKGSSRAQDFSFAFSVEPVR